MSRADRNRAIPLFVPTLLACCLGASGCTFESGKGFGTLNAKLSSSFAGLDPDTGRVQQDGWYRTNNSFELQLGTLQLTYRNITLRGGSVSGSASDDDCRFDPANPPPGCSLCHNGHCHCGDALEDYDQIEAELCRGSVTSGPTATSGATALAQMQVPGPQDLLGQGTKSVLGDCSAVGDPRLESQSGPVCELDAGSLEVVQLLLERLHVKARLRDRSAADRLEGDELTITIDRDFAGAPMAVQIDPAQPVDHKSPPELALEMSLPVSAKLFDDIAWETLHRDDQTITIDARHNTAAGEQITSNLALSQPHVTVTREDDDGDADAGVQDASDGGSEDDPNEEACEHTKQGPFVPAEGAAPAAGTDAASALQVRADHKAYRVALSAGQQGWIRYSADAPGELVVFLSQDVGLAANNDSNPPQAIPVEDKSTVDECTEVATRHTIDLDNVGTVYLLLGGAPTQSDELTIVVEHGDHHREGHP